MFLQVLRSAGGYLRCVPKVTDSEIAGVTEEASDPPRDMAVVYAKMFTGLSRATADRALVALLLEHPVVVIRCHAVAPAEVFFAVVPSASPSSCSQ